ncbi:MAG TPA: hypothetical protein VF070_13890 [Streptosporangiaceae bacterium]
MIRRHLGLLAAAVVVLAGCGAAGASSGHLTSAGRPGGPGRPGGSGTESGTRAEALAFGRRLVSSVKLPPGARPAHLAQVPQPVRNPFTAWGTSAVAGQVYLAPRSMDAVYAFVRGRTPDGTSSPGTGQQSGPSGVAAEMLSWEAAERPAGIYSATLDVLIAPRSGGSALVGVYAWVTWIPARPTTEHIDPRSYRRVFVTAVSYGQTVRRVTRTFTSAAVVSRLSGYLNSLAAAPDVAMSCPPPAVVYQLTFTGYGVPDVVVSANGCLGEGITVGGKEQPGLSDPGNQLAAMTGGLLNITPPAGH